MNALREKQDKAMVVGLGKTGLSVARYLHSLGYAVAVTDSRAAPPALDDLRNTLPDAAVFVGGFSESALVNADIVVVSPGIPLNDPFIERIRQAGTELVGDIELFSRAVTKPVLAVTGSNGKSTVATLLAGMVEHAGKRVGLGGNVGTPALELLASPDTEVYVLELSSFQLESTRSLAPAAAVVLNVTPDHIDWHGDMASYARAKSRIYHNAAVCVFNRDDEWSTRLAGELPNAISFGLGEPARGVDFGISSRDGRAWLMRGQEPLLRVDELALAGTHNHANALAAFALGDAIGLPRVAMLEALKTFQGLAHRMSRVAEKRGIIYVNDSKGTNVGATVAAINGADRMIVLIAGGDGKGQDFSKLAQAASGRVRHVVLIGRAAGDIDRALGGRVPATHARGMHEAVALATELAEQGDMVLLSPACSSQDMFANYEARGEAFVRAVLESGS